MKRPRFHNALANPTPTGRGTLPPLCPDTTQAVLEHMNVPFLCLLKSVSTSVANACRRRLRESDLTDIMERSNPTFPVRVLFDSCFTEYRDLEVPTDVYIVHALTLEVRHEGRRVTDPEEVRTFLKTYVHTTEHVNETERDKFQFDTPTFCVERPGVGIFHSPGQLWEHMELGERLRRDDGDSPYERCLRAQQQTVKLLLSLQPLVTVGPRTYIFPAYGLLDTGDVFPASLMHLLAAERIDAGQ